MSFGGSVLAMIISIKNNARLKQNAHDRWKSDKNYRYKKHKSLNFKKVSKEELTKVIAKNRKQAKRERLIQTILTILVFFLTLCITSKFFTKKGENILESHQRRRQERIDEYNQKIINEKQKEEERLMYFLNDGYKWLNKKHYKNAKFQFYKAYELKPDDYRVKLANTTLYVRICLEEDVNCHVADRMLEELKTNYIDRIEVKDLIKMYEEKIK